MRTFNEELFRRKLYSLADTAQNITQELHSQLDSRVADDKATPQTIEEVIANERAFVEAIGVLIEAQRINQKIKAELLVAQAKQVEAREVESATVKRMESLVDKTADTGTLLTNIVEYYQSSPPALSELLEHTPAQTLNTAVDLLADLDKWEAVETLYQAAREKLASRQR